MVRSKRKLTIIDCENLFQLPVAKAAHRLGVSRPTISRVMRENGYSRWPYRSISACSSRRGHLRNMTAAPVENRTSEMCSSRPVRKGEQTTAAVHYDDTTSLCPREANPIFLLAIACEAAERETEIGTSGSQFDFVMNPENGLESGPKDISLRNILDVSFQSVVKDKPKLQQFVADAVALGDVFFIVHRPAGTLRMHGRFNRELKVNQRSDGSEYIATVSKDCSLAACIDVNQVAYIDFIDTVNRGAYANILREVGEVSENLRIVRFLDRDFHVLVAAVLRDICSSIEFHGLREKYGAISSITA